MNIVIHYIEADMEFAIQIARLFIAFPKNVMFQEWDENHSMSEMQECLRYSSKPLLAVWLLSERATREYGPIFEVEVNILRSQGTGRLSELAFCREIGEFPKALLGMASIEVPNLVRNSVEMTTATIEIGKASGTGQSRSFEVLSKWMEQTQTERIWDEFKNPLLAS